MYVWLLGQAIKNRILNFPSHILSNGNTAVKDIAYKASLCNTESKLRLSSELKQLSFFNSSEIQNKSYYSQSSHTISCTIWYRT